MIPPGVICVDLVLHSQFFCEIGINRSQVLTSGNWYLAYSVLAIMGLFYAVASKKYWRCIAVLPLTILALIPHIETPDPSQMMSLSYVTTNDEITDGFLQERIDRAVAVAKEKNVLSSPDTVEATSQKNYVVSSFGSLASSLDEVAGETDQIQQLRDRLAALPRRTVVECLEDGGCSDGRRPGRDDFRLGQGRTYSYEVIIDEQQAASINQDIAAKQQNLTELQALAEQNTARFANSVRDFNAALDAVSAVSPISFQSVAWQALGIAAFLSLVVMLGEIGMRSPAFVLLFVTLIGATIFTSSGSPDFQTSGLLFSVFPVFLFVVACVIIKLGILAIQQNRDLSLDKGELRSLVRKTMSRWWVIVAFAAFGFWATAKIDSFATHTIYCIGQTDYTSVTDSECDPLAGEVVRDWPEKSDIEGDIELSIDTHFANAENRIDSELQQILDSTDGSGEAVRTSVLNFVFDGGEAAILPAPLYDYYVPSLRPPSCGWFPPQIGCYFERQIKKAINAAYENTRNRERSRLSQRLSEIGSQGEAGATDQLQAISAELHSSLNSARLAVKTMVSNTFMTISLLNLFANFLLCIALIKSFMFIFARFYFDGRQERYLPMQADLPEHQSIPEVTDHEANYNFRTSEDSHYVNRKFDVAGAPENISVPMPLQGIIRRVLSRTWVVNHVELPHHPNASIQTGQAAHFVEWNLKKGEKIYVDPQKLVSFSKGVQIKTEVSLRITSIMFGRLLFLTISGPGTAVFRTSGVPIICPDAASGASFSPNRFVAWSAMSRLGITARTDLANVYFSSSQIALREAKDGAVIDAMAEDARGIGAIKFIPACILPF